MPAVDCANEAGKFAREGPLPEFMAVRYRQVEVQAEVADVLEDGWVKMGKGRWESVLGL